MLKLVIYNPEKDYNLLPSRSEHQALAEHIVALLTFCVNNVTIEKHLEIPQPEAVDDWPGLAAPQELQRRMDQGSGDKAYSMAWAHVSGGITAVKTS